MKFVNIGFGNYVAANNICCILEGKAVKSGIGKTMSAPTRRAIADAKDTGKSIDASTGRGVCSVLFMTDGRVILSSKAPDTLLGRLKELEG